MAEAHIVVGAEHAVQLLAVDRVLALRGRGAVKGGGTQMFAVDGMPALKGRGESVGKGGNVLARSLQPIEIPGLVAGVSGGGETCGIRILTIEQILALTCG